MFQKVVGSNIVSSVKKTSIFQLALFRSVRDKPDHVLEKNYRPVQKLNDREVLHVTPN